MIQLIGLMIGAYTFVRLISLATRKGERRELVGVQVLAILAAILILFLSAGVLLTNLDIPSTSNLEGF